MFQGVLIMDFKLFMCVGKLLINITYAKVGPLLPATGTPNKFDPKTFYPLTYLYKQIFDPTSPKKNVNVFKKFLPDLKSFFGGGRRGRLQFFGTFSYLLVNISVHATLQA